MCPACPAVAKEERTEALRALAVAAEEFERAKAVLATEFNLTLVDYRP